MGNTLQHGTVELLAEIGRQLDQHLFPRVMNGGVVVPSDVDVLSSTLGKENERVFKSATRRSAAGSWPRAAGWQRSSSRSWTPSASAPFLGAAAEESREAKLGEVRQAYPGALTQSDDYGYWLFVPSAVLDGLQRHVMFAIAVASAWSIVRSWAFWMHPLAIPEWIGPRHTNFFDGSICAFEPSDETWNYGDSLVSLVDLYTVWALRHLHLQVFGRWPGYQAVHHPIERILELRDDEYCGCGTTTSLYGQCCKAKDRSTSRVKDAVQFALSPRRPPRSLLDYVQRAKALPRIVDVLV